MTQPLVRLLHRSDILVCLVFTGYLANVSAVCSLCANNRIFRSQSRFHFPHIFILLDRQINVYKLLRFCLTPIL